MKYINWKATAKTGNMLVNIHESTLSQKVAVLLDMEGLGVQQADVLNEEAVRVACALCSRLLEAGVRLSVASNGVDVHSGRPLDLPEVSGAGSVLSLRKSFACLQAGNGLAPIQSFFPEGTAACCACWSPAACGRTWPGSSPSGRASGSGCTSPPAWRCRKNSPGWGRVHRFYWEV